MFWAPERAPSEPRPPTSTATGAPSSAGSTTRCDAPKYDSTCFVLVDASAPGAPVFGRVPSNEERGDSRSPGRERDTRRRRCSAEHVGGPSRHHDGVRELRVTNDEGQRGHFSKSRQARSRGCSPPPMDCLDDRTLGAPLARSSRFPSKELVLTTVILGPRYLARLRPADGRFRSTSSFDRRAVARRLPGSASSRWAP